MAVGVHNTHGFFCRRSGEGGRPAGTLAVGQRSDAGGIKSLPVDFFPETALRTDASGAERPRQRHPPERYSEGARAGSSAPALRRTIRAENPRPCAGDREPEFRCRGVPAICSRSFREDASGRRCRMRFATSRRRRRGVSRKSPDSAPTSFRCGRSEGAASAPTA